VATSARALGIVAIAGLVLGFVAQLLRQVAEPVMAVGAATAPWLTIGFLAAIWATRTVSSRRKVLGFAATLIYLVGWIVSYHVTFAIRESVPLAAGWREAAVWLLLAGPVSVVLGIAAALTHERGVLGDVSLALPVAWSTPEVVDYVIQGWSYAVVVGLPTVVLAVIPFVAIEDRNVKAGRVVVAGIVFAIVGLAALPLARLYIPTY
jgi:hypothetical protein